ncbi:MAG TPA: hypothetical protein VI199_12465 [Novosphingobium sp.]
MRKTGKAIRTSDGRNGGLSPAVLLSGAVVCLALPSAVLAFSSGLDSRALRPAESAGGIDTLAPALAAGEFARHLTVPGLTRGKLFRFTPAGSTMRQGRSVTVAVRVDSDTARTITVRAPLGTPQLAADLGRLRIAPTAYSLGVSRGFQSFVIPGELHRADTPDLAGFKLGMKPATTAPDEPSRLNARLALDQKERTGRAPRTLESSGEQIVDFAGSYRLTRNIDVTAGVRYSQDRDRLVPLVPDRQKDNQAVYVGTQFRF